MFRSLVYREFQNISMVPMVPNEVGPGCPYLSFEQVQYQEREPERASELTV